MDDHIAKPIDPRELAEVLGRWLPERIRADAVAQDRPATGIQETRETPPRFDLAEARVRLDGDDQLLAELLQQFAEEYGTVVSDASILQTLARAQGQTLRRWAHSLKSVAALFGADDLAAAAFALEVAADERRDDDIAVLIDLVRSRLASAVGVAAGLVESPPVNLAKDAAPEPD